MAKQHKRKAIVFVSLVGVLTFTSTLLLVMAPAPLRPGTSATLFNAGQTPTNELDVIFQTDRPVTQGRWTSILVRHSRTQTGSARTIADPTQGVGDHFVICNGKGGSDGEIEISARWMGQAPALAPQGSRAIDNGCITICLVGDFDRAKPSALQMRRLTQLISQLQTQLQIPGDRVWTLSAPRSPTGVGSTFPTATFRAGLVR